MAGISGIDGEAGKGLLNCHSLFRKPAGCRLITVILTGDAGMQSVKWVRGFHREVGAVSNHGPRISQFTPGIGALDSHLTQTILSHVLVAGGVGGLDGCDYTQFGEAENIFIA